jgi:Holliday junction resolvasome RuvABC endonuclease subunit
MKRKVQLLACDPGTANFGYAIVEAVIEDGKCPSQFKVLQYGKLNCTVRQLTGSMSDNIGMYVATIKFIMDKYPELNGAILERFQTRGIGGPTIELVSLMIGIISTFFYEKSLPVKAIIASQWKQSCSRSSIVLDDMYVKYKDAVKATPHEVDAVMIGLYGMHLFARHKPYDVTFSRKLLNNLLKLDARVLIGDTQNRKGKRK